MKEQLTSCDKSAGHHVQKRSMSVNLVYWTGVWCASYCSMNTSAEFLAMSQRGLYMDFGIVCCVYFVKAEKPTW